MFFGDKKKFNLEGSVYFQKYWHVNDFQKRITQWGIVEEDSLMIGAGCSSSPGKFQFSSHRQKAADYVKMLRMALSMWRRMDFSTR